MRRAILAVLATAVGLVLLLSFKPHEVTSPAARPAAVAEGTGSGPGDSGPQDAQTQDAQTQETQSQETQGGWSGAGATAGATSGEKTVTGDSADTRWGPV